ncbi:MAG: hypothetical protein ABW171_12230 [Steroidobacter sp.]
MSYYTHVEIAVIDGDLASDPHEQQVARVKPFIEKFRSMEHRDGFDGMYLDQIEEILAGKLVLMHGYSSQAEEFVRFLSECFPDTTFAARGMGEELDDLWRLRYVNGRKIAENPGRAFPSPQPEAGAPLFTRVPNASGKGWRSFIRPAYLRALLAAVILLVAAILVLS